MPNSLASTTSGQVVMFNTSAPQALNMKLSALEENLGPSMVNIVPVSLMFSPIFSAVLIIIFLEKKMLF